MAEQVLKFGGSSVSSGKNILAVADTIIEHYLVGMVTNVVISAFGIEPGKKGVKVTDSTISVAEYALKGNEAAALKKVGDLKRLHYAIVDDLHLDRALVDSPLSKLEETIKSAAEEISKGNSVNGAKLKDSAAAVGELSSTPVVATVTQRILERKFSLLEDKLKKGALTAAETEIYERLRRCNGIYTYVVADPGEAGFVSDSRFGDATLLDKSLDVEIGRHHQSIRAKNKDRIIFYPGFVAKDEQGNRTTLSRDGSNTTATALAAAINADKIFIYSDTNGVQIVDPRIIGKSQTSRRLSLTEVLMLGDWGGMKVIQDKSMTPLFRKGRNIPIVVKNTFNPQDPGTLITHVPDKSYSRAKGISVINGVSCRELPLQSEGDYFKILEILRKYEGVEVLWSSLEGVKGQQSTGKFVLSLKNDPKKEWSKGYFKEDLFHIIREKVYGGRNIKGSFNYHTASLITLCGDGLGNSFEERAKIYNLLESCGWHERLKTSVHRFPCWQTEDSLHLVVPERNVDNIVNLLYNQMKRINIVLYGLGNVGRAFLRKVKEQYNMLGLNVVGVVDSTGGYAKPGGFSQNDLERILEAKEAGTGLAGMHVNGDEVSLSAGQSKNFNNFYGMENGQFVLVDATSEEKMTGRLLQALKLGCSTISVNKKPFAMIPPETDRKGRVKRQVSALFSALFENRSFIRGTVGANIGVPDTLFDILAKEPKYVSVRCCASGTLGVAQSEPLEFPFSQAIGDTIVKKLAEAYPFDDYSGRDVLNKTLIMWRTIAAKYGIDPFNAAISYESFIEPVIKKYEAMTGKNFDRSGISQLKGEEFVERMKPLDSAFAALRRELPEGYVFRYVGEIMYDERSGNYSISVGLKKIHKDSPLGALQGPDNRFLFGINGPPENPHKIAFGKGAGVGETSDALMNDLKQVISITRDSSAGTSISYKGIPVPQRGKQALQNYSSHAAAAARTSPLH